GGLAEAQERAAQAKAKFGAAFGEDLNVAEALAELFKFTKDVKSALAKNLYQKKAAAVILDQYRDFDRILAALDVDAALAQKQEQQAEQSDVPADVLALVQKRVEAKKAKDFATADAIRNELKAQGWLIEDSPAGPRVTKA
ncbi:MAG: hypothetical protein IJW07_00595, partial [Lentisphaeria bacterium]|nr:hypothetical protein [Lentisphaeria bacterium]